MSNSNKRLWSVESKLRSIWEYHKKPSAYKFSKILGFKQSSLERMVKKFKEFDKDIV